MDRQKVRYPQRRKCGKNRTFLSDVFLSVRTCPLFTLSSKLAKILVLWTKELLQTPSELGDTVSQSRQCGIHAKIPMKLHWVETLDFHEKSRVADFETLYLRAQMEFGGALWCKVRVFYLTKMVG